MKKEENKYIFSNVFALVDYIRYLYGKTHDHKEISPIKLQKSLYFLFAFWGGMIEKSKDNSEYVEYDFSNYSQYLFEEQFQAWVYGPVLPEVYRKYKDIDKEVPKEYDENKLFNNDSFLKDTTNSILNDIFDVADFKLVSLAHEDLCWKSHFDIEELTHENTIPREEIVYEYSKRESII